MESTLWHSLIPRVTPYIVRIDTPNGGRGTGFVGACDNLLTLIFTAAHVIEDAARRNETVTIFHHDSGKSTDVHIDGGRVVVHIETQADMAVLVVGNTMLSPLGLPKAQPALMEENYRMKIGAEVGWLGFPSIAPPENLCFFHGYVSSWLVKERVYLTDGVGIHGVSGGPAFFVPTTEQLPRIAGVVTNYIPNMVTSSGEEKALPGAVVIREIRPLQKFKKIFEALNLDTNIPKTIFD